MRRTSITRRRQGSGAYGSVGGVHWLEPELATPGNLSDLADLDRVSPGGIYVHWHARGRPCGALCGRPTQEPAPGR